MSLTNKLRHIGYALSVGTLSVLAVNVEPAKADISSQFTTQGDVMSYCKSMKNQDKTNHFWTYRGFDTNNWGNVMLNQQKYNGDNQLSVLMVYQGYVYHVGGLGLTGKTVTQNTVCKSIKKLAPVNKEVDEWVKVSCNGLGCFGGYYKKVLYKLENNNIDLNFYQTNEAGEVSRMNYKNFHYIKL